MDCLLSNRRADSFWFQYFFVKYGIQRQGLNYFDAGREQESLMLEQTQISMSCWFFTKSMGNVSRDVGHGNPL